MHGETGEPQRLLGRVWPYIGCGLSWVVFFGCVAVWRGPEATWDLRNYHIYGPFSVLKWRFASDLAPAQVQTFYVPSIDIPAYWLRTWLNDEPDLLSALLSLPQSIGAFLATLTALRFMPSSLRWRWPAAMLLVAVGATGVASFSTLATSQSEMIPGCFTLAGFLLLLRLVETHAVSWRKVAIAGLLFGTSTGLKLTSAPYELGAVAAVLVAWPGPIRAKSAAALTLSLGILGGALLSGGWWWLHLYVDYGNPLFPSYNNLFRSPYIPAESFTDQRFKPSGLLQSLFYPFYWGLSWRHPTAETVMRDPRFMLAYIAFWLAAIQSLLRPRDDFRKVRLPLTFFSVSYVFLEAEFSVLRYLAPIEMLSGIVIFLAARDLFGGRRGFRVVGLAAAATVTVLLVLTVNPDWGHAKRGGAAISVHLPPMREGSLVLLLDPAPMAYLAPHMPSSTRIVGVNNSFLHPGQVGRLAEQAEHLIKTWQGQIYGLEDPGDWPGVADRTLQHYGLEREGECSDVHSNLEQNAGHTMVCTLTHIMN